MWRRKRSRSSSGGSSSEGPAVRFLHTSDWHVGKTIGGRSRADEHRAVLAEILDISRREKIDCLLVTGDVFESAAPGAEAEKIVYDFFRDLGRAQIPAVVIAGNHDHERKLAAGSSLLEIVDVHVRHDFLRPNGGGIFELESKRGERAAIGTIPFIPEHRMLQARDLMEEDAISFQKYADGMAAILREFGRALEPHPIRLLMGHLHVDKSQLGGGERELHIGHTYAVPAAGLPAGLHYFALGHIHRPQEVPGPSPTRFAGSPLALDFSEAPQKKSVVIVDVASPNQPAHVETVELTAGRRLRDVRGTLDELLSRTESFGDDYLRAFLQVEKPVPGLADEVRKRLPNAIQIRLETDVTPAADLSRDRLTPGHDRIELFSRYHRSKYASDPEPELLALFRELLSQAAGEDEG